MNAFLPCWASFTPHARCEVPLKAQFKLVPSLPAGVLTLEATAEVALDTLDPHSAKADIIWPKDVNSPPQEKRERERESLNVEVRGQLVRVGFHLLWCELQGSDFRLQHAL